MRLFGAVIAILAACAIAACGGGDGAEAADLSGLSVRQLAGQRMVFAYSGTQPPRALRRRIARGEAAGVILFGRNVRSTAQVRRTIRSLQAIRRPRAVDAPLLVLVDQEGGRVVRLPGGPSRSAARTRTIAQARDAGRTAGRALRAAGANVDLAPVVDVARPGSAMERERRAYGRDARQVSALAAAFARGLADHRVLATYKHFPGFGAATVNTDDAPARIPVPLATLRGVDALPYRRLPPNARLVMLSTAVYPALDPRPAAFSRRWIGGELRRRLGFDGVTVSDDLHTPAVSRYGTPAQRAFYAARAGVDLPLFASGYRVSAQAAEGLTRAARSGALPRRELEEGARRVLELRRSLPR